MADFPPELVRKIVEHVQDDITTLKATSLTSKAWSMASRERLFHHYTLPPIPRDDNIDVPTPKMGDAARGWQTPLAFVRHLTFSDGRKDGLLSTMATPSASPLLDIMFPNLTALTFSRVAFIDPAQLVQIVVLCPRLIQLAVQEVVFQRVTATPSPKLIPGASPDSRPGCTPDLPTHLARLQIRNTATRYILLALFTRKPSTVDGSSNKCPRAPPPRITHYAMSPIVQEDLPVLRIFQDHLTGHLVHLSIGYDLDASPTGFWCPAEEANGDPGGKNLASLVYSQLRTLYIGNFINGGQPRNFTAHLIPGLLTAKKMPKLERVVFELALRKVGELDYVDSEGGTAVVWHFLDDTLGSLGSDSSMGSGLNGWNGTLGLSESDRDKPNGCGGYEFLKEVIFHVTGNADVDGLRSLLVARLPKIHRRGLLRICRPNEYSYPL